MITHHIAFVFGICAITDRSMDLYCFYDAEVGMDGFGYSMFLSRALMEDDAWFDLLYLRILAPDPVDLFGNSTFAQSNWTFDMYLFLS